MLCINVACHWPSSVKQLAAVTCCDRQQPTQSGQLQATRTRCLVEPDFVNALPKCGGLRCLDRLGVPLSEACQGLPHSFRASGAAQPSSALLRL